MTRGSGTAGYQHKPAAPVSPKSSSSGATRSAIGFLRAEGAGVAACAGQGRDFYEADITNRADGGTFTGAGTVTDATPGP